MPVYFPKPTAIWLQPNSLRKQSKSLLAVDLSHAPQYPTSDAPSDSPSPLGTQRTDHQGRGSDAVGRSPSPPETSQHLLTTKDEEARKRMLNKMMPEAMKARYLLFPIHQNFHWTILVLDIEEGSWKLYNSMRPRGAMAKDPHFNAANEVETECIINSPEQEDTSLIVESLFAIS